MTFRHIFFCTLLAGWPLFAAETPYRAFEGMNRGHVAFCRPSMLDELQFIGEPRMLTADEAKKLAVLFSSKESWYETKPDGSEIGMVSMCMPHWDFKFVLMSEESYIAMRLFTSCYKVAAYANGMRLKLPDLRKPAMVELGKIFDEWFPGWAKITYQNYVNWLKREKPNKAPEPTTTSVTSPAAQEPRQP